MEANAGIIELRKGRFDMQVKFGDLDKSGIISLSGKSVWVG